VPKTCLRRDVLTVLTTRPEGGACLTCQNLISARTLTRSGLNTVDP
jgi:hypothetical protein